MREPAAYSPRAAASASLAVSTGTPGQPGLQVLGDRVGVPPGQDRRLAGPSGLRVDRARQAQPGTAQVAAAEVRACPAALPMAVGDPVEHHRGPRLDRRRRSRSSPSTVPPRSVTRDPGVRGVDGGGQDPGLRGVEGQAAPPPAAGGLAGLALDDHPGAEQRVEPLGDGHPGQPGRPRATSPRVVARPCRIRSRMSPGPVGTATSFAWQGVARLSVTTGHQMLDRCAT